jgi:hypothetical protein
MYLQDRWSKPSLIAAVVTALALLFVLGTQAIGRPGKHPDVAYRHALSPLRPPWLGHHSRVHPTTSQFAQVPAPPSPGEPQPGPAPGPGQTPAAEKPAPPVKETSPPPVEEAVPVEEPPHHGKPPAEEPPAQEPPAEEPPAEPPPPPPSEPGTEIFTGTEISDFDQLQQRAGAITEVQDPLSKSREVLKMTVKDSDVYPITPTEDPRAQALSPNVLEPGDEFWWNSEFMLPPSFPSSVPGWVTLLEGPYGPPFGGTPPWHIEVNGDSIQWSRNGTYGWDVPWQMQLVRNQWVHVLVHERFATDGWVEMWINGQPITFFTAGDYNPSNEPAATRLDMQTLDSSNDQGPNFLVILNYREAGMFESTTVYQGPMRVGTTRESVEEPLEG